MIHDIKYSIATATLAISLIFVSLGAQAIWAQLSDSDLITKSDMIVVGTYAKSEKLADLPNAPMRSVGVIEIETVLKGSADRKTVRLDIPQSGTPVSSTDIAYKIGQKGLWYLRLLEPQKAAIYAADHPQRFVAMSKAGPPIEAVRKFLSR